MNFFNTKILFAVILSYRVKDKDFCNDKVHFVTDEVMTFVHEYHIFNKHALNRRRSEHTLIYTRLGRRSTKHALRRYQTTRTRSWQRLN